MSAAQRRVNELSSRVSELEEALSRTQRELARAQENNVKLQRDLRENAAQKVDQVRNLMGLVHTSILELLCLYPLAPCFRHSITLIPNMTEVEPEIMQFEL